MRQNSVDSENQCANVFNHNYRVGNTQTHSNALTMLLHILWSTILCIKTQLINFMFVGKFLAPIFVHLCASKSNNMNQLDCNKVCVKIEYKETPLNILSSSRILGFFPIIQAAFCCCMLCTVPLFNKFQYSIGYCYLAASRQRCMRHLFVSCACKLLIAPVSRRNEISAERLLKDVEMWKHKRYFFALTKKRDFVLFYWSWSLGPLHQ